MVSDGFRKCSTSIPTSCALHVHGIRWFQQVQHLHSRNLCALHVHAFLIADRDFIEGDGYNLIYFLEVIQIIDNGWVEA